MLYVHPYIYSRFMIEYIRKLIKSLRDIVNLFMDTFYFTSRRSCSLKLLRGLDAILSVP